MLVACSHGRIQHKVAVMNITINKLNNSAPGNRQAGASTLTVAIGGWRCML
jgi:hypothetical protein